MENQSVARNLAYHRKLKGYSQDELSEKTGITIRTIQRIENDEVNPHLKTVKLLAEALEIDVNDLLALEDPKEEAVQKKWLLLLHGTPILGLTLPLCNILIPLFLWIHKREDNPLYEQHGRAIVNFHITMTLLFAISLIALVTIEGYGFILFITVLPYTVIVTVINIVTAVNSHRCFYPLSFPFLRKNKKEVSKARGIFVIAILFNIIGAGLASSQPVTRLDGTTITKDSLSTKIGQLMDAGKAHGMAVTVFNNNQVSYQQTFGYKNYSKKEVLNDSTNIYGASLSKAVFSVLVMKLVEEGVIDLDTPLESYLPGKIYEYEPRAEWHDSFFDLEEDSLYHKITARMCLMNTTGFPNWRWFEPDQKLRVKFEPGSRYSYSGEGFVYLQVILEQMLNRNLEDLAQENIFRPLGMDRTGYQWNHAYDDNFAYGHSTSGELHHKDTDNEPRSASTLETTAEDYSTFLEAVLQRKLISDASWNEIFKPGIRIRSVKQFGPMAETDSTLNDDIRLSYGLGWGILETPFGRGAFKEGHGDGFQHYTIVFPSAGKGVMIMTNSDNGESIFKELLETAMADTYTPWEWENYIPYNQQP